MTFLLGSNYRENNKAFLFTHENNLHCIHRQLPPLIDLYTLFLFLDIPYLIISLVKKGKE